MRVLLIDDEEPALDVLEILLSKIEGIEIVGKYQNPELAFQDLAKLQVEVIFLDMDMGEVHGIEFAERLMADYSHIEILFVTAYPQFALEAFEVNAIDYLLKPVSIERLKRAISKTRAKIDVYKVKKVPSMPKAQLSLYAYTMNSFRLIDLEHNIVKWRTRKVKELFVFLWHHHENPVHKSRVVEELWPEMDVNKSVTLLHTTVYHLRKTLKELGLDNPLNLVNDQYILLVSLTSDMNEIKAILQTKEINPLKVGRILELYSGDYLAEEDYSWAIQAQQFIKESVLHYLEKFIAAAKDLEEHELLVEASLKRMLMLDLYNETYMLQLLEHYGQTNNIEKMKNMFQLISKRLNDELRTGIPSEMKQLYNHYLD